MNSLFPISSPSVIYRELAACAPILEKFGMALSPAETAALAEQQSAALRSSGRIDLSGGAVKQLALIFCDSPYILRADWPYMLSQLLSLFYALKNETADHIGDTALINAMYLRFHSVGGDMDALAGTPPEWLRHAAEGGDLDEL